MNSNTNYILLGMIIKQVTGKKLGAVPEADVIKPLSLDSTRFDDSAGFIESRPHAARRASQAVRGGHLELTRVAKYVG